VKLTNIVDNPRGACGGRPNPKFRDGNDRSIEGIA
jgi:hypothetical protein